jgi:exosortase/archaeosortase family protein
MIRSLIAQTKEKLAVYIDVDYLGKFLVLAIGLYGINYLCCGLVDPQGLLYSSLLDNHLNYVAAIRKSILYASNGFNHFAGINSHVALPFEVRSEKGWYVFMWYPCIGLGLMSFWSAFVIAHRQRTAGKIAWTLAGIVALWVINVGRLSMLMIAHERHWKLNSVIDHHTQYNLLSYALLLGMIMLYLRVNKKEIQQPFTRLPEATPGNLLL